MSLIANIQPINIGKEIATQVGCYVIYYDLKASNCTIYWWLFDENQSCIFNSNWNIPKEIIDTWNADDNILIHALADQMGYTITSIVQ